jgi:hypothetical protein
LSSAKVQPKNDRWVSHGDSPVFAARGAGQSSAKSTTCSPTAGGWQALVRTGAVAALIWAAAGSSGHAQNWAKALFDHTSKDLGVVARGAKVEHVFMVENIYNEDVHVSAIRSSCQCTVPHINQPLLKTYEKTELVAVVDTRSEPGRKEATLTVVLDKPFPAEVQLNVYCFIRSDVVFQPGSVQFGSVPLGASTQRRATVSYAGRKDWRIVKVDTSNPHLEATATEVGRGPSPVAPRSTQVTYDLVVKLKADAPVGHFRDQVVVVTDDPDPRNAQVPFSVEGLVVPAVTVSPSPLSLGAVVVGKSATTNLVVKANEAFRIVGATCSDERFSFTPPAESKMVQVLPVTFKAGTVAGKVSAVIRIETDMAANRFVEVKADGQVVPQATPAATP